jgi:hypothetical protein
MCCILFLAPVELQVGHDAVNRFLGQAVYLCQHWLQHACLLCVPQTVKRLRPSPKGWRSEHLQGNIVLIGH